MNQNKKPAKILIGITGGIAAYKVCELINLLNYKEAKTAIYYQQGLTDFKQGLRYK